MPEIICSANYVDGLNVFQVEKETYTEEIVITLYDMRNGRHDLRSKISYLNVKYSDLGIIQTRKK